MTADAAAQMQRMQQNLLTSIANGSNVSLENMLPRIILDHVLWPDIISCSLIQILDLLQIITLTKEKPPRFFSLRYFAFTSQHLILSSKAP